MSNYRDYWENRLARDPNLRGTGHRAFSLDYNKKLYQAQKDCLNLMLAKHQVDLRGKKVLDVGSGIGYYIHFFKAANVAQVVGIDITETSVEYLQEAFPSYEFYICDIGSEQIPLDGPFDVISAISVLYHLIEDTRFERAIRHLSNLLSNNGYLLITDTFSRSLLPSAPHARFRTLNAYQEVLFEHGLHIVDILPVYYLLNKTLLPLIGPFLLRSKWLQQQFYEIDKRWRQEGRPNGRGMKLMLARKPQQGSATAEEKLSIANIN
jgi:SAM-dependent methyltransferase